MDGKGTEVRKHASPLFIWVGLMIILTFVNFVVVGVWLNSHRGVGYVEIGLMAVLYVALIFTPSDAKELDRIIDIEAATATLGITFWLGFWWSPIADALHLSKTVTPDSVSVFVFVTYLLSKALVALRYRA
jgi:hypothetical protein